MKTQALPTPAEMSVWKMVLKLSIVASACIGICYGFAVTMSSLVKLFS